MFCLSSFVSGSVCFRRFSLSQRSFLVDIRRDLDRALFLGLVRGPSHDLDLSNSGSVRHVQMVRRVLGGWVSVSSVGLMVGFSLVPSSVGNVLLLFSRVLQWCLGRWFLGMTVYVVLLIGVSLFLGLMWVELVLLCCMWCSVGDRHWVEWDSVLCFPSLAGSSGSRSDASAVLAARLSIFASLNHLLWAWVDVPFPRPKIFFALLAFLFPLIVLKYPLRFY